MLWWWSLEIALLAVAVTVPSLLSRLVSPWAALAAVLGVPLLVVVIGPVRRFVSAWSWCVVVRHRLRLCFAGIVRGAGGVRPGSLPLVLWAKPTPAGERAWLWLRPGLELLDLDGKTGRIAVACWANEVRVMRASARFAALLRIDVARPGQARGQVTTSGRGEDHHRCARRAADRGTGGAVVGPRRRVRGGGDRWVHRHALG